MAAKRIAVINDNTAFLQFMQELLTEEGYETILWVASESAHDMVINQRPDLVVLDLRMERIDSGLLVLEMLRMDPKTQDIPVILCSADLPFLRIQAERLRALRCEVQEKPFTLDDLLDKITAFVGRPEPTT
jgi:two-component system phosphate regulon response regulator PhoB